MDPNVQLRNLPDDMAPNFFTVNSKGEITAEFSGTINAFGLILPEEEKVGAASEIKWVDSAGKTHSIIRSSGLAVGILELIANSENVGEQGRAILRAQGFEPGQESSLFIRSSKGSRSVTAFADALEALLLNNSGESSFLQLLTEGKRKVAFGAIPLIFAKEATKSNIATISHGLGTVPKAIILSMVSKGINENLPVGIYEAEEGTPEINFKVQAWCTGPTTGLKLPIAKWLAIG